VIDMPLMMQHGWGRHLYKLQQFPYRMTAEMHNEAKRLMRLWKRGQTKELLLRVGKYAALAGTSAGIIELRNAIRGKDTLENETTIARWLEYVSHSGTFAWYFDMWFNAIQDRYGKGPLRLVGPVFEELWDIFELATQTATAVGGDIASAAKLKPRLPRAANPLTGYTIESIPEPWRSRLELRKTGREMRKIKQDDVLVEWGIAEPDETKSKGRQMGRRGR
jgi:hypothetical protein